MKPAAGYESYFTEYVYGHSGRIVFICGGWKMRPFMYRFLIRSLLKKGFRCVLYVPHTNLIAIGTPYTAVVEASRRLSTHIASRIQEEKAYGAVTFACWGISFGTIFATEAAKRCPDITRLLLFAPFGDFAEHVTLWPRHRYFSKVLASQPTGQAASGEVLNQVGLGRRLHELSAAVLVVYAAKDSMIHASVTKGFIEQLRQHTLPVGVVRVPGGHLYGIGRSLLYNRPYVTFLDKGHVKNEYLL